MSQYLEEKNFDASDETQEGLNMAFKGHIMHFSKQNETEAWAHIGEAADKALKNYPTTIEEDKEILKKGDLTKN